MDAETCDVVTVGAPASPRQLLVGGVSFDVDAIGDAIPWQAAPRRLPLIAATMVASFALHAGAAWLCSAAQREGEPIDPVTKVTARQLAAIRGYLARADARVESNGDVEEIPAEPPGSMPSLAPSWGSRQWSCKNNEECVASAVSDGACCTPICAEPYVYSAAFARALEEQWRAYCPASGCGPGGVTVRCPATPSAVPWCKDGTCVDARHDASWDRVPYDSKDDEDLRPFLSESPQVPVSRAVPLPVPIQIHIAPLGVWGGWKKEELTQTVRKAGVHLRVCFKMELTREPAMEDSAVTVRLLRNRDGSVDVRPKSASPSALTRCVVDSLRKLDFPAGHEMAEAEYRIWFEKPTLE